MKANFLRSGVLAAGAILLLSSCDKKEDGLEIDNASPIEFVASMPSAGIDAIDTKTTTIDGTRVLWCNDDHISIFRGRNMNEEYKVKDGFGGRTTTTLVKVSDDEFSAGSGDPFDANIAYYPYGNIDYIGSNGSHALGVNIPNTQTYVKGSFGKEALPMIAVSSSKSDNTLDFKNLFGFLKLQLKSAEATILIKQIIIKGNNGEKLSGEATVSCSANGEPTVKFNSDAGKSIILECNNTAINAITATDFWIALPPVTFSKGITVEIVTSAATIEKKTSASLTITRSKVKPLEVLTIKQDITVKAEKLTVSFINTSGTIDNYLYIGKSYDFSVTATPNDATTNYEWKVANSKIGTITSSGEKATLNTKNYGESNIIVTDKISGLSTSYKFATCVTNFMFTESSKVQNYGYPVVTIVVGSQHKIKCSYSPSYITGVFFDLTPFIFKEIDPNLNQYVDVPKSSVVDIDENGVITAKKVGTTIMKAYNRDGVFVKSSDNCGIFINVVKEINPYGTIGGHEYVDLGLPSGKLWATQNFGATSKTDFGSYYMWSSSDRVPNSWGTKWNTPTIGEYKELIENCSCTWTFINGVSGYLLTGKNGATLFLPAAGFKIYTEEYGYSDIQGKSSNVVYWSMTKSDQSWEGHILAYALDGSTSKSPSVNITYNASLIAAPIRPISR